LFSAGFRPHSSPSDCSTTVLFPFALLPALPDVLAFISIVCYRYLFPFAITTHFVTTPLPPIRYLLHDVTGAVRLPARSSVTRTVVLEPFYATTTVATTPQPCCSPQALCSHSCFATSWEFVVSVRPSTVHLFPVVDAVPAMHLFPLFIDVCCHLFPFSVDVCLMTIQCSGDTFPITLF